MKELNQIALQKGLFASIKRHLCLTKGHLDDPKGQMEAQNWKLFLVSFVYIKKNKFLSKRALSNNYPIPGRFIFLK